VKPGQFDKLVKKLDEFHAGDKYMLPGTVGRYIAHSEEDKSDIQIVLIWRSTVMPAKDARNEEVRTLKDELADVLDWQVSWHVFSRMMLHT